MSGINANLDPLQSLSRIGYRGIFKAGSSTPPEVRTYAAWSPTNKSANITLSNGNLTASESGGGTWFTALSTLTKSSGKWYWEYTLPTSTAYVGMASDNFPVSFQTLLGQYQYSCGWGTNGHIEVNNGNVWQDLTYGSTLTSSDVIGVAFDADAGTTTYYKNGVSQGVGYTVPANTPLCPGVSLNNSNIIANFGATPFAYAVPTGYNQGLYTV